MFKKVREILTKYLPKYFYDLPVPFIAVATNFSNGEPIYLENGNLVDAIMASAAYPGVFPTQEINGKSLIDGGMTRNLPAGILQKRGIEFVIGSSLYRIKNLPEYDLPNINPNRFSSFLRAMDIIQMELAHYEEKRCDFCFTPPVESFAWYNFDRFEEIRKVGIDYAIEIRSELEKALKSPKKKSPFWRKIFS
ncbi:MAG: patatin-like phospholipase family protein, partial [Candidatus Berkelbacteria bacterium]|nr:patatin-like phospholipase family protein [Candidatus Berkelbacteria bacterium]